MAKRGLAVSLILVLILSAFVVLARKKAYAQTTTWTASGVITLIGSLESNNGVAILTSAPYIGNGCTGWSNQYVIYPSDPANQTMQSLILAAFVSGKRVALALNGCWGNGAPIIRVVSVQP
jgi:hypothetical protein